MKRRRIYFVALGLVIVSAAIGHELREDTPGIGKACEPHMKLNDGSTLWRCQP